MSNTTFFKTEPPAMHIQSQVMVAEQTVDFSKQNVTAGNTADIFKIPAGTIILGAYRYVNKTQATVTFTLGTADDSGNNDIFTAATLGAANTMIAHGEDFVPIACATETTVRTAVAAATASSAIVTFGLIYAVVGNQQTL